MSSTVRVFVGTYTQTTSKGIYVYDVDTDTGVMEYVSHVGGITNPSFLVLTPDARFLYAVGETGDPHGGVFAYAVDASGTLTPLNSRSTHGSADPAPSTCTAAAGPSWWPITAAGPFRPFP